MMEKRRILIIDDEAGFTRLLKVNLEATGRYMVRAAHSGAEGLSLVDEFDPELILLDVMMPDMDGGAVAERLQASRQSRSIPVVFLTAAVKPEEVGARGGLIGGLPFLAKPVSLAAVIECIEKYLPAKQMNAAGPQNTPRPLS